MTAAVFYGPNKISVENIRIKPNHSDSDLVLKVNASAICGYDVRVFRFGHKKITPPIVLGHEICGELVDSLSGIETISGNRLKTIEAGTRVTVSPLLPCLSCVYCSYRHLNLCANLREIGSSVNGGFAEYIRIPRETLEIGGLIPIPDSLRSEEAALLEPLACCLNGFSKVTPVTKDKLCVVIGDGPIGLLHLQLSKNVYGARKTIVVGKIPSRLQMARTLGADETILLDQNTNEKIIEILDITEQIGADIIMVATSSPEALDFAIRIANKNSKINVFAGLPEGARLKLDLDWLHYNQITITGSFSSTPDTLNLATILASYKKVDLSKIITHRYSLDKIWEAILSTENYNGLRVIVDKFR